MVIKQFLQKSFYNYDFIRRTKIRGVFSGILCYLQISHILSISVHSTIGLYIHSQEQEHEQDDTEQLHLQELEQVLLSAQSTPLQPSLQKHSRRPSSTSLQIPPFLHGLL